MRERSTAMDRNSSFASDDALLGHVQDSQVPAGSHTQTPSTEREESRPREPSSSASTD